MNIETQKRYVATADFYVYADTDEEAIQKAKSIAKAQDIKYDDRCSLIELCEQPTGTIINRQIDINTLKY